MKSSEEDFSLIMLEERNIVVTDSLVLATKKNFEMSSSRPNVGDESLADASETSLYKSEFFSQNFGEKDSKVEEGVVDSNPGTTPVNFSGLAFKSTQKNSIFQKVKFFYSLRPKFEIVDFLCFHYLIFATAVNYDCKMSICDIDFFNFHNMQAQKFKILKSSEKNWNSAVIFRKH